MAKDRILFITDNSVQSNAILMKKNSIRALTKEPNDKAEELSALSFPDLSRYLAVWPVGNSMPVKWVVPGLVR
jgi:hypothetical protein